MDLTLLANRQKDNKRGMQFGCFARCWVIGVLAALMSFGEIGAAYEPAILTSHRPVKPDEHPRLIVRGDGLAVLKRDAQEPWGQQIVTRMKQALKLMEKMAITGRNRDVLKEAGFEAAGHGAIYALEASQSSAAAAKKIAITEVVLYPLTSRLSMMDRLSRLGGTAIAYDLCYDAWDETTRKKVRTFLLRESQRVIDAVKNEGIDHADGPEAVTAWATAGLVELAVLGDHEDPQAGDRIAACERSVIAYMEEAVAEHGVGLYGESVKQAAFASGVLPFVHANRLVLGRNLGNHPAVQNVLVPMVYQTIPEVGMPVIGPGTMAKDRSGLFAMAGAFIPKQDKPPVIWLFEQIGGDKYQGVVRPHQGLYMLGAGLHGIEAKAPQNRWPRYLQSRQANVGLLRSRWRDKDDIVAMLHGRDLRILGMGAQWAAHRGVHSTRWSDAPGIGALGNVFGFHANMYQTSVSGELTHFQVLADGERASMTMLLKGEVARLKSSVVLKDKVNGEKRERDVPVPTAGSFTGYRALAVDYTGLCGAPALFVLADRIEGAGQAPRSWVLHAGYESTFVLDGPSFTITNEDTTLRGTAVFPEGIVFRGESNPPYTNFIHFQTDSPEIQIIMTLQQGEAPNVINTGKSLLAGVRVGPQMIKLSGDKIELTD